MSPVEIIIPVYNEGANILKVLAALKAGVRTPYEVMICYDRDTDDTLPPLAAHRAEYPNVRLVKNKYRGVHGAIVTGFESGRSEAVIVFPADDTYNAGLIDRMNAEFEKGADIVAPSRFMKGGCMKGCPPLKAFLVRVSAFILYHVARLPVHDPTNGFRLFSRRVLRDIPLESTEGFAFSIEYLVKAHKKKMKIVEIPALWFERGEGRSRFKVFKWLPIYLRWFFYAFSPAHPLQ